MSQISARILEKLMQPATEFGGLVPSLFCSWAVWVEPDQKQEWRIPESFDRSSSLVFPPVSDELAAVLHTDCVFLGTTPGESAFDRLAGRDGWQPFHAVGRSRDDRVAEALRDTNLWGAFMTDLFPLIHLDKSILVSGWLKDEKNLPTIKKNFEAFEWLLTQVGALQTTSESTPVLLCFGAQTAKFAELFLAGPGRLTKREYRVVKLDSYSPANRKLNTTAYRALVRSAVEASYPELY